MQEEQPMENTFAQASSKSDVVLVVEGQRFHVSKVVLSLVSPVFEVMFEGHFKENSENFIPLPGKKPDDIMQFLLCIYPHTLKSVTIDNVEAVLALAEEYQVAVLKQKCRSFIVSSMEDMSKLLKMEELVHFIKLGEVYTMKDVVQSGIKMANCRKMTGPGSLSKCNDFKMLTQKTKYSLVWQRVVRLEKGPELDERRVHRNIFGHNVAM